MTNRRTFPILLLAVVTLSTSALLFGGAPLKGVDVKLGKNPGGQAAARTTADDGSFDFGVLPKGSYSLTLSLPRNHAARDQAAATCVVELNDGGKTTRVGWDFNKGRRFDPSNESTARAAASEAIEWTSDGTHPMSGQVVKSKPNISNN